MKNQSLAPGAPVTGGPGSILDYFRSLALATRLEDVWDLHCRAMAELGFDRLLYGYTHAVTEDSFNAFEDAMFLSNYSSAYFDQFVRHKMFIDAPMTRWALHNVGACSWGQIRHWQSELSARQRAIIAFNRSMNVSAGYTISFPSPRPHSFAVISLAGRRGFSQDEVDKIWARDGKQIETMNHVLHLKILSLPHQTNRAKLSQRQREVLEWVGEGKSNQDIATILGVSVATIEKHLRLAREKLGVDTTPQAILKASFHNQIFFFESESDAS